MTEHAGESKALTFAYADPPYLGCCGLYDHFHRDLNGVFGYDGRCWDDPDTHRQLIDRLTVDYPDGWALSLSSPSLRTILPMCPEDVRVSAWCKSFSAFKKGVRPAYAWEPVIWRGGRNPTNGYKHAPPEKGGKQNTPKDFHWIDGFEPSALLAPITLKKGFTGAKPESFCEWVIALLNVQPGDTLDDLFPGTGVMGRVLATAYSGRHLDGES